MCKHSPRIGDNERMRHAVESRAFRLQERPDIERVPIQVKNARLAASIEASNAQAARVKQRGVASIEAKAAMVLFRNLAFTINFGNARARLQNNIVRSLDQRAAKRIASNAPSILSYGLAGTIHSPSKAISLSSLSLSNNGVGSHSVSTRHSTFRAANASARGIAMSARTSGLKSPINPIRTISLAL